MKFIALAIVLSLSPTTSFANRLAPVLVTSEFDCDNLKTCQDLVNALKRVEILYPLREQLREKALLHCEERQTQLRSLELLIGSKYDKVVALAEFSCP